PSSSSWCAASRRWGSSRCGPATTSPSTIPCTKRSRCWRRTFRSPAGSEIRAVRAGAPRRGAGVRVGVDRRPRLLPQSHVRSAHVAGDVHSDHQPDPRSEQFELVRRVEALGFESVWTGDHVSFHNPMYEALTLLATYIPITSRI